MTTKTETGPTESGGCGAKRAGSRKARCAGRSRSPPTANPIPSVSVIVPIESGMPSWSSAACEPQAMSPTRAGSRGRPMIRQSSAHTSRSGTRVPPGKAPFCTSLALPNAPAHSTPPRLRIRSSTLLFRFAAGSARITIERVPAESMELITACSAPTVRPEVSSTAAHIPAIITIVMVVATGDAQAETAASRATANARLTVPAFGRIARPRPGHALRRRLRRRDGPEYEALRPQSLKRTDRGSRSVRRREVRQGHLSAPGTTRCVAPAHLKLGPVSRPSSVPHRIAPSIHPRGRQNPDVAHDDRGPSRGCCRGPFETDLGRHPGKRIQISSPEPKPSRDRCDYGMAARPTAPPRHWASALGRAGTRASTCRGPTAQ